MELELKKKLKLIIIWCTFLIIAAVLFVLGNNLFFNDPNNVFITVGLFGSGFIVIFLFMCFIVIDLFSIPIFKKDKPSKSEVASQIESLKTNNIKVYSTQEREIGNCRGCSQRMPLKNGYCKSCNYKSYLSIGYVLSLFIMIIYAIYELISITVSQIIDKWYY